MLSKKRKRNGGFTLVELIVAIAIMAVMLAVLAPSLLKYTESSRAQKDESAMNEVVNAVQLALIESNVLDESLRYEISNNFLTYSDSSGIYGNQETDEEFWAPDGAGRATTITFNPTHALGGSQYVFADGFVNEMTYGNGSMVTPTRLMQERGNADPIQCKFSEMSLNDGSLNSLLYSRIKQTIGETVSMTSATYKNSSYTIFIKYSIQDGVVKANVTGGFNGTNLSEGCKAAIGSGTDGYDENNKPNGNKHGTTNSIIDSSALQGGGTVSFTNYPTLDGEYIDPQKFWDFCATVADDIKEIKVVAAYTEEATDISVSGNGRIVAFQEGNGIYITAATPGAGDSRYNYSYKIRPAENASHLFDANKTGFQNVEKIYAHMLDMSKVKSVTGLFQDNAALTVIDIEPWNTGSIESFSYMFSGCTTLKNIKIVKWDTAKATDTSYMFADCQTLSFVDCSQFTTNKVENMSYMFYNCAKLKTIDVSAFKTPAVRDMSHMFEGCVKVKELKVNKFDVGICTNFNSMFKDCLLVPTLDVSSWETSLATDMGKMFMNCKSLKALDFENWKTNNVTVMESMLYSCQNIEELDLNTVNSLAVQDITNMFSGMNRLKMVTIGSKFSFKGNGRTVCVLPTPSYLYIEEADGMWRDENGTLYSPSNIPSKLAATYHAVSDTLPAILCERDTWWKGETDKSAITRIKIVNKYRSPNYTETWIADNENNGSIVVYIEGTTAYLVNMKNSRVRNAFQLSYDASKTFSGFTNCTEITGLKLMNLINTSITDDFFSGCESLRTIDGYERWNVQNVVSANKMFTDTKLSFLKLGGWDLANITSMKSMFENTQLAELDLSNWNVSDVVSFDSMFKDSKKLSALLLKSWETSPDANYTDMFSGCSELSTISTSKKFTVGTTNTRMFAGCTRIQGGAGTTYIDETSKYACVDTGVVPGYFTSDDNIGAFSARLYYTGSATSQYDELTYSGITVDNWDYTDGARLLEIHLYSMPKTTEKTVTVSVPEGVYIVNNSWTSTGGAVKDVKFTTLDRSTQNGIQQNAGTNYVNNQTGTVTFTVDQYTAQTILQVLVDIDLTLWSKKASDLGITVEDAVVVQLSAGANNLTKKVNTIKTNKSLSNIGITLGVDLQTKIAYVGEPVKLIRTIWFSSNNTGLSQYYKEMEVKITTNGTQSGLSAKITDVASQPGNIVTDKSTDYVYHKVFKNALNPGIPQLTYLLESDKAWKTDEQLQIIYEITTTSFNGEKITYKNTQKVSIKTTDLDLTLFKLSPSSPYVPPYSFYDEMDDDVVDFLGCMYLSYEGFAEVKNVEFKYEYDINNTGAPNLLVQSARVVVPQGKTLTANVTVVNESGVQKGPYEYKLSSTNNQYGSFVRAMSAIPAAEAGSERWYLKTIIYTTDLTGSKTETTNYHHYWAQNSSIGAGTFSGRAKKQASSKLTMSLNGTAFKTATATTRITNNPVVATSIGAVETPLGNRIIAGNQIQFDVKLQGVNYPYANTCNMVNPTLYMVLPEDISIIGAKITSGNKTTVLDANPIVTRKKMFTKDDGASMVIYEVTASAPLSLAAYAVGQTGITSKNYPAYFQIMCETDNTMKSATLNLKDTIWFGDKNTSVHMTGSYEAHISQDKYDVNGNGNTTECFATLNNTTASVTIVENDG